MRNACLALLLVALFPCSAWPQNLNYLNGNRPLVDAHNCYPDDGQWSDRIDRALSAGFPVGIEQDLAWWVKPGTAEGRIVVSHTSKTQGAEPGLREYFFEKVRPLIERELASGDSRKWPLITLHFDFKDNQPALLDAVWKLLGEYEPWITTAPKTSDPASLAPFKMAPILVLTEDNDAQEDVFFRQVPVGAKLRLFGSAHTTPIQTEDRKERAHLMATLPPAKLLTERPSNYRRWWNNSWAEVEEGGAPGAGDWTRADATRLRALVDHAHQRGFWIRFYTLDGFTSATNKGWGNSYNFGSKAAAEIRWKAASAAGVNLIATDQYEELAPFVRR